MLEVGVRADNDEAIASVDKSFRSGIEDQMAFGGLDAQDDGAALLMEERIAQRFAGQGTPFLNADFADFHVEPFFAEGSVNEIEHIRTQEQLRDSCADEVVG